MTYATSAQLRKTVTLFLQADDKMKAQGSAYRTP